MNIVALKKIVEQMKAHEELCFNSHRDSEHPENAAWGIAWQAQKEARKAVESLLTPASDDPHASAIFALHRKRQGLS